MTPAVRRSLDLGLLVALLLMAAFMVRGWQAVDDGEGARSQALPPTPGTIDLLRLIDPARDTLLGEWRRDGKSLVSPVTQWGRIQIPYRPPEEYDLEIIGVRETGHDALAVGLGKGQAAFAVWIDGFPDRDGLSGLDRLDGSLIEDSPARVPGLRIRNARSFRILAAVRDAGVTVTVDGERVVDWKGEFSRLSPSPVWRPRSPGAPLFVGADSSRVRFQGIILKPVSGQGEPLR